MQTNLIKLFAVVVIFFGLFIRFYHVPTLPDLHVDEMSFGYSAYSWIKTGVDEYGRPPGILLQSLGDWKLALYSYFVVPFVLLFGLNEWSVRLPSVVFSLLTLPFLYVLTRRLTGDTRVAWVSVLLLWITPWHIVFSRTANEVTMQLFLLVVGMVAFFKAVDKGRTLYFLASAALFALALIAYYPGFVIVPSMTYESMNLQRSVLGLPALVMITGLVVVQLARLLAAFGLALRMANGVNVSVLLGICT